MVSGKNCCLTFQLRPQALLSVQNVPEQSRTQSLQAFLSTVGRLERLWRDPYWDNGIYSNIFLFFSLVVSLLTTNQKLQGIFKELEINSMPLSQRPTADKEPEKLWARDWVRTADQPRPQGLLGIQYFDRREDPGDEVGLPTSRELNYGLLPVES